MTKSSDDKIPPASRVTKPVNVVDGIPNRSASLRAWKYILLAAVFGAWVGFLLYCRIAG